MVTRQQELRAGAATALRGKTQRGAGRASRAVKLVVDRLLAALLLLLALPILIAAALLLELSDPGPLFYRQARVGRNGVEFRMWKLRTMHAERAGASASLAPGKRRGDPRVTRAGRLLRRSSLDELPQLLNVLGGSMSLVGPRPWLPEELDALGAQPRRCLDVRPGMTGLWQVSGRASLDVTDRVALDLAYVDGWSLALDARIMMRTIPAVLGARGAY